MGKLVRALVRMGAIAAAAFVGLKFWKQYRGAPEGVGREPFSFTSGSTDDPCAVDEATLGGAVSPDLLDRLVCPLDKGPLQLVDGKWLVNRRNGYRYPISDGIPVMLVEVGERYRDLSLIDEKAAPDPSRSEEQT